MGYVTLVANRSTAEDTAFLAPSNLTQEHLVDTPWHGTAATPFCLRSVPIFFIMTMGMEIVKGNIADQATIDAFAALNNDAADWINAISAAHNAKDKVAKIFGKIEGHETMSTRTLRPPTMRPRPRCSR